MALPEQTYSRILHSVFEVLVDSVLTYDLKELPCRGMLYFIWLFSS